MSKEKIKAPETLMELQKVLANRIGVTLCEDLTSEERTIENAQSMLITALAKQMINNGDLILRAEKLAAQNKTLTESKIMQLIG